jgi:hypothetical protein
MKMVNVGEQIFVVLGEKIRRFIGNQVDVQVGYELQIQVAEQVFNPLFVLVESNLISVKRNSKI